MEEGLSVDVCRYCFDVLKNHFQSHHKIATPLFDNHSFPLFVTWQTIKSSTVKKIITSSSNGSSSSSSSTSNGGSGSSNGFFSKHHKKIDDNKTSSSSSSSSSSFAKSNRMNIDNDSDEDIDDEDEDEDDESNYTLRGCIGTFSAKSLHSGLRDFTLTSALRDRRFSPIREKELHTLSCGVSLLVKFEEGENYLDWTIGVHGIWIEFTDENGCKETATYLPEVIPAQKWTKVEAIDSLLRKGGFRGKITNAVRNGIKLTRYQSLKFKMTYNEYLAMTGVKV